MNKKTLFLVITLIAMLILVTSVNATNDNTNTSTTHSISKKTTTTEPVVKEKIENTQTKELKKTNKTTESKKTDPVTIDGVTYTNVIENQTINQAVTYMENTYINNSTFNSDEFPGVTLEDTRRTYLINNTNMNSFLYTAGGEVRIYNTILNDGFYNWESKVYIDDSVILTDKFYLLHDPNEDLPFNGGDLGTIYTNNEKLIEKLEELGITYEPLNNPYEGNNEINNEIIDKDMDIPITGNITLTNCQINAKITNQGNVTLVNCSLSNNNMVSAGSKADGFLIENNGNLTMIGCIVENNTFEVTGTTASPSGVIVNKNNAIMSLNNTLFNNNTNTGRDNSLIYNLGIISYFNNCSFTNNNMKCYIDGYKYGVIVDEFTLTITDSLFENNRDNVFDVINLNVKNSNFNNNKYIFLESGTPGGREEPSGIAITAINLNVDNCTFDGNGIISKHQYTGSGGSGGAISATNIVVNNSRFINNVANTTSTWWPTIGTGGAISAANTEIYNSIFENNMASNLGADIYSTVNSIIKNNTFTGSYSTNTASSIYAYVESYSWLQNNVTIINNTFTDCKSSLDTIVVEQSDETGIASDVIIENNIYNNDTINDELTLNVPSKIFTGEPITITGTYNIVNASFYDEDILEQNKFNVYINGELNQTVDTLEFTITPIEGNMIVTVQPTISQTRETESIRGTTLTNIIITPENYNEYVFEGKLVGVNKDTKAIFQGTFTDKEDISIKTSDIVIDGSNATFTNTCFILEATGIVFQNMNINNTQTDYPIKNTADNNIITHNTIIITNTEGKTATISNQASNTEITYNTLYVDGPAMSVDYSGGLGFANTQAILLVGGDKNKVEYNTIEVTSSGESSIFGTVEGITNHDHATNTLIANNDITVSGNAKFNYAINSLGNVQNITIQDNNILVTGERYTDGIQVGTGAENVLIQGNTIKCICQNTTPVDEEAITYGIVTTNMGSTLSNNITITENNIDITGSVNYGIEVYQTTNTLITDNIINVNGLQSMGIGYAHSPNSTVTGNTIQTSGDSSVPLTQVTEEIQPKNVGIQLQQDSENILIEGNTIQTYDKAGRDNCINVETNNVTIRNNNLTSSTKVGTATVDPQLDTVLDNNGAIEQESSTITEDEIVLGESTTLTASFYDDEYVPISEGKAIFRINGKTLRDDQGNVIYADVINGRAELPDINITQEWTKESTTIQAVYCGNENVAPIMAEESVISVTQPEATVTLEAPEQATAGQTITLTARVSDGEKAVNSGRVAFKLNGKTLKDPKTGKALYANVENGIATITYTIPAKTKAIEYTLTVVFTDTKYDRVEAESKLNVVKA